MEGNILELNEYKNYLFKIYKKEIQKINKYLYKKTT